MLIGTLSRLMNMFPGLPVTHACATRGLIGTNALSKTMLEYYEFYLVQDVLYEDPVRRAQGEKSRHPYPYLVAANVFYAFVAACIMGRSSSKST